MTIKEAIERLQCMRLFMEINDKQNESKFLEDDYIANDMAIKALEEKTMFNEIMHELSEYQAIGTVEEFKVLKEKNVAKKIIQTVENGRMKRIFSCCGTDCTQMTSWMIPKFCPHCGSKTETRL